MNDDGLCKSCFDGRCTTGPECVALSNPPMPDDYQSDDDDEFDEDPGVDCGRWSNGKLTPHCSRSGTEECDFECPYRDSASI